MPKYIKVFQKFISVFSYVSILCSTSLSATALDDVLEDIYGEDDLISIASGMIEPIHRAPSVASVISREQIDQIGAVTLEEALGLVPGVHVSRYAIANNPIYVFRGLYSEFNQQVLLLIDGQPMTRLFNRDRGTTWGDLPLAAVQRIEIIHGPGSAIYGADAFAGVINVITAKPNEADSQTGFQAGGSDTFYAWHHQNFVVMNRPANFTIEYRNSSGRERLVAADGQTLIDSLFGTQVSNAPGETNLELSAWDARLNIDFNTWLLQAGLQIRTDLGTGLGSSFTLDPLGSQNAQRGTLLLSQHTQPTKIKDLTSKLRLAYSYSSDEQSLVLNPPGTFVTFRRDVPPSLYTEGVIGSPSSKEWDIRFEHSFVYTGWKHHRLRFDYGFYYGDLFETSEVKNFDATGAQLPNIQDVSDNPDLVYLLPQDLFVRYGLLENRWSLTQAFELTAGIRLDDYSNFGTTANPRASFVWQLDDNSTVKLLYGRAFRSPSFAELYIINNPVIQGEPNLEPEVINSYDISFIERMGFDSQLTVNLFFNEIEDSIGLITSDNGKFVFTNDKGLKSKGFNLGYETILNAAHTINSGFSHQKIENQATNTDIGRYPKNNLFLNYHWDINDQWRLGGLWRWITDRDRTLADPRSPLDGYDVLDLKVTRKLSTGFSASFIAKNVFDADIREPASQLTLVDPSLPPVPSVPNDLPLDKRLILFEVRYTATGQE